MPASNDRFASIGEALGSLVARVPAAHQPLFIAAAERMAADRYRGWATRMKDASRAAQLTACAEREEEIARRIEGLFPDASARQREILAGMPELDDITRRLFDDRPLREQLEIQAGGERLGAATWRAFAKRAPDGARETFLACAELEEHSAEVLESFLREEAFLR